MYGFRRDPFLTCVAFKSGVLAADTLVCANYGLRLGHRAKIFMSPQGIAYGFSGETSCEALFIEWLNGGFQFDKRPEFESHQAIRIQGTKVSLSSGKKPVFVEVEAPFYAIGSGCEIALGAMWMGATAEQAVEAAIALSENCGGSVDVLRVYEQSSQFAPGVAPVNFPDRINPIHTGGPR